jgi:four helix bundle protein
MQFLAIARGSTLEIQAQLEIAQMLGFGDREQMSRAEELALEELKILNASLVSLQAKQDLKKRR